MTRKFTPPKRALNRQQRELMWMLEDGGSADLRCIVATLKPDDLCELEADIRGLLNLGYVRLYRDLGSPGHRYLPLLESEVAVLPNLQELLSRFDQTIAAGILITDAGLVALKR